MLCATSTSGRERSRPPTPSVPRSSGSGAKRDLEPVWNPGHAVEARQVPGQEHSREERCARGSPVDPPNRALFRLRSTSGLEPRPRLAALVQPRPRGPLPPGLRRSAERRRRSDHRRPERPVQEGLAVAFVSSSSTADTALDGRARLSAAQGFAAAARGTGASYSVAQVQGGKSPPAAGRSSASRPPGALQSVRAVAFPTVRSGVIPAYESGRRRRVRTRPSASSSTPATARCSRARAPCTTRPTTASSTLVEIKTFGRGCPPSRPAVPTTRSRSAPASATWTASSMRQPAQRHRAAADQGRHHPDLGGHRVRAGAIPLRARRRRAARHTTSPRLRLQRRRRVPRGSIAAATPGA